MSVADPIVSRRALLAAAALAAPLARAELGAALCAAGTGEAAAARAKGWDRAMARFRAAEAELGAEPGGVDRLYDRLLGRLNRALSRLLRTPAPDAGALSDKLDLLIAHEAWELNFAGPALAALRADAHRFAGRA